MSKPIDYGGYYKTKYSDYSKIMVEATITSLYHITEDKEATKYSLYISSLTYANTEPIKIITRSTELSYFNPMPTKENLHCMIVRPDNANSLLALGLNSTSRYFCQVILISLYTNIGKFLLH